MGAGDTVPGRNAGGWDFVSGAILRGGWGVGWGCECVTKGSGGVVLKEGEGAEGVRVI